MLSKFNSDKFRFWSFVSMALLVFVHGYNIEPRYLQPWTLPEQAFSRTAFTEYFFANGILRFRIPMLFIISGYLYALHDYGVNRDRVKKRVRTLLVPYLLWSGLCLLIFYALEMHPAGSALISASHIAQIDETRVFVHQYRWYEILARWILVPLPYQLWFIRVLFVYNLAYPLIRRWLAGPTSKWMLFAIAALLWLGTMNFLLFEGEGLLFFSLGVWIQKTGFDIDKPGRWLDPRVWGLVFVGAAASKTWLAFQGQPLLGDWLFPILTVLHKLTVGSGLIAAWFGCDALVGWCMARRWFVWLTAFSFIIYAVHAPWVAMLIDPTIRLLGSGPGDQMLAFVLLPPALIAFAVVLGAAMRKVAPGVYGVLTGGRGL
jgi:fucose 4-O-acetylase-like acetyltransferase